MCEGLQIAMYHRSRLVVKRRFLDPPVPPAGDAPDLKPEKHMLCTAEMINNKSEVEVCGI